MVSARARQVNGKRVALKRERCAQRPLAAVGGAECVVVEALEDGYTVAESVRALLATF